MTAPPKDARTTLEAERVSGRDVFISYAREDQPFVRRLHDALADRGRNPWVDWEGIPPSAEWLREVKRAIEATESFIFVLSPDSAASRVCREEAEHAAATGKRVIPLLRREVDDAAVPEAVAAHNWISFRDEDDFDASTDALSRALDTDLDWVRAHTRLLVRAAEWDEEGRDRSFLLRGKDLESAERWLAEAGRHPEPKPTSLHTEYILASRRAAVRAQRGRLAGLAAAVLISLILAAVAFVQQRRAEEQTRVARSRELAATSLEQLERDPQLSLLLAIEAYERAPTAQAEAAVRRALVNSHLRRVLPVDSADVTFFDVGPDGKLIATASPDGKLIALWDRASGERLAVLEDPEGGAAPEGDPGPPVHPSFSPDGSLLLVKQPDGSAVIWSVPDRRLVTRLEEMVFFGGWTPDGGSVLVVGNEGAIRLHDSATGEVRAEFVGSAPPSHEGFGPPATLSPDGRNVAISDGPNVRVMRVATGRTLAVFKGAPVEFSLDGRYLIADVDEDSVQIFDVQSLRPVRVLDVGPLADDAALSPDGTRLLTGHADGARIWDVRSGQRLVELLGHGAAVWTVAFSPDGRTALTAGEDSTARLWDVETGRTLAVLAGHAGPVERAMFTPDGRAVVSSSIGSGADVRIWEVGGGETAVLRGHEAPVTTARFSPDGRSIVSAGVDGTARGWDVATERQTALLRPPRFPGSLELILFAEFGTDDRLGVISGYQGGPNPLPDQEPARLWDVRSGQVRLEVAPPRGGVCFRPGPCPFLDAALSPDGTRLATVGEGGALRLWDAANGTELGLAQLGQRASGVEWTPDGAAIVTVTEGAGEDPGAGPLPSSIVVVDPVTLRKTREFGQVETTFSRSGLELSADGSLAAMGAGDRTAQVFEVATGRLVVELPHTGPVFDVGFSPDGRFLVTASSDTPTIWDLESQRPLVELFGHRAGVLTAEFSPDGSSILSAGVDQTIRIWRCEVCAPVDQLLDLARERALRDLTAPERARYLHEG